MIRISLTTIALAALFALGILHIAPAGAKAEEPCHRCRDCCAGRGGVFGWRHYSHQQRRNFPDCYGGFQRYYGGFHANYFRNYPGNFDGLNHRDEWGSGWAW